MTYTDSLKPRASSASLASVIALAATALVVLPFLSISGAFVLAGVLVVCLACWQWQPLLYLVIFLLPMAPIVQTDFPIHDLVSLLRVLIFTGVFLRKLLDHSSLGRWLFGSTVDKLALLYLAVAALSVLIHPGAGWGVRALFRLVSYLSLYYTVTAWVQSRAQLFQLMKVLLVSTLLVCALGCYQFIANGYGQWFYWFYRSQKEYIEPFAGRITSVFLHVNPFAAFLNLVLPLALAMRAKLPDPRAAGLAGLCFFMGTLTLFLTESRGALVAFVFMVGLAFRYILKDWISRKRVLTQVAAALLIAVAAYQVRDRLLEPPAPPPDAAASDTQTTSERFTTLNDATLTRLLIYGRAWSFFTSSPVIGVGYGNFPYLFGAQKEGGPESVWDTHSLYLKLLSETGLAGAFCYLGLVVVVCRWARSGLVGSASVSDRIVFFAVLGATVTMLLHGFVDVMLDVPQFAGLLWLLFAALPLLQRFQKSDASPAMSYSPAGQES